MYLIALVHFKGFEMWSGALIKDEEDANKKEVSNFIFHFFGGGGGQIFRRCILHQSFRGS